MKQGKHKAAISSILTAAALLGAFSFKVEYDRAADQEKIGRLVVSMSLNCNK